jgi:hypothetical protein
MLEIVIQYVRNHTKDIWQTAFLDFIFEIENDDPPKDLVDDCLDQLGHEIT